MLNVPLSFIENNSGHSTNKKLHRRKQDCQIFSGAVYAPLEKKSRLIRNIIGNEKMLVGYMIAITDNFMAYDFVKTVNYFLLLVHAMRHSATLFSAL